MQKVGNLTECAESQEFLLDAGDISLVEKISWRVPTPYLGVNHGCPSILFQGAYEKLPCEYVENGRLLPNAEQH